MLSIVFFPNVDFSFLFPFLCIASLVLVAQFVFFILAPFGTTIGSGEFWTRRRAGRAIWRPVALTNEGAHSPRYLTCLVLLEYFFHRGSISRHGWFTKLSRSESETHDRNYRKIRLITVALSTPSWPRVIPFSLCLPPRRLSRFSGPSGSGRLFTSTMSTVDDDGPISVQRVRG